MKSVLEEAQGNKAKEMTLRYRDESFIRFCFVIYVFQFRVLWLFCFLLFFFFNILFLFCVLFCVCVFFLYFRFGIQRCVSVSYSRVSVLGLGFPLWLALDQQNNNGLFVRASRFLYISLPSLHNYDVKLPNFTSYGRGKNKTTTFPGLR